MISLPFWLLFHSMFKTELWVVVHVIDVVIQLGLSAVWLKLTLIGSCGLLALLSFNLYFFVRLMELRKYSSYHWMTCGSMFFNIIDFYASLGFSQVFLCWWMQLSSWTLPLLLLDALNTFIFKYSLNIRFLFLMVL